MPPKKSRRGRPPLRVSERRRQIISVRLRDETRERLEQAAKENGRSLSQEAEMRIEQSFPRPGVAAAVGRASGSQTNEEMRELVQQLKGVAAQLEGVGGQLGEITLKATGTLQPAKEPKK